MTTLQFHPVADIFPLINGADFDALRADIAANGLLEAIWLHPDGRIIDGRNRYRACCEIGVTPDFRIYSGSLDTPALVQFVVSLNLKRRHLDSGQKAFVALEVERVLGEAARERQGQRNDLHPTSFKDLNKVDDPMSTRAAEQAAQIIGTNRQYVSDAKRIQEQAPDLAAAVKQGDMKITEARRQLQRRTVAEETPAMPTTTYRVIYADPPWKYGNQGLDDYGHAERHYPAMNIAELCSLNVRTLADADAVLFLWVTSPLLAECFAVIEAWGFTYKTSFVWDKVRHNFGHYNSVRHELLLVCTRGSCLPDAPTLFDSVQTIERTEHSVKPEEFRQIIDALYTTGRRIELFSRREAAGWERWGNECSN
jgi:N6-adenosine-specific RNA methylase IME4